VGQRFGLRFFLGLFERLGVGGYNKALQKMEISSFWKPVINGATTVKAKGLGAASDQIKKE
jgi:hypothetical protein